MPTYANAPQPRILIISALALPFLAMAACIASMIVPIIVTEVVRAVVGV